MSISLEKTTSIVCEECSQSLFTEGVILRRASKFLTGTKQDAIIPIPVFMCAKCGNVNEEFLPKELVSKLAKEEED